MSAPPFLGRGQKRRTRSVEGFAVIWASQKAGRGKPSEKMIKTNISRLRQTFGKNDHREGRGHVEFLGVEGEMFIFYPSSFFFLPSGTERTTTCFCWLASIRCWLELDRVSCFPPESNNRLCEGYKNATPDNTDVKQSESGWIYWK